MTTIETLTLIRDHIRNVLLPIAQGKQEGKWEWDEASEDRKGYNTQCLDAKYGSVIYHEAAWAPEAGDTAFIAMTSDTAEPAWLCVAEEIGGLLEILGAFPPLDSIRYAELRAASIINNWKHTIK